MPSRQKLGTILLNKFPWEWFILKILLMKVVLLIKYSDEKIIFRKIQLSFGLQNWLWKLKMSNFWQFSIKMPYKISKNPFRRLIQMQNYWISSALLRNSTTLTILIFNLLLQGCKQCWTWQFEGRCLGFQSWRKCKREIQKGRRHQRFAWPSEIYQGNLERICRKNNLRPPWKCWNTPQGKAICYIGDFNW